jgi:hypothetical protein
MGRFNLGVIVVGIIVMVAGVFTHPNIVLVGLGIFLFGIVIFVFRRFFGKILE